MSLYYEAHITLDPYEGEDLELLKEVCAVSGFRSTVDSFCTGRHKDLIELHSRTLELLRALNARGFILRRYKIESALLDSKISDEWGIFG